MADRGTDVLMRMVLADSAQPLYADCQTEVTTDEDDFVYDYYNGQFFEVMDFSFGLNLDDKAPTTDAVNPAAAAPPSAGAGPPAGLRLTPADLQAARAGLRGGRGGGGPQEMPQSAFARWKSATPEQIKSMPPYPLKMDEFSITRLYDKASPVLFEKCCNSDSLASASLVKRKLIGANMLRGFLRIDFEEVLLTHVEWQNGEVIKETFKFVFRKMTAQYRIVVFKKDSRVPEMRTLPAVEWNFDMELKKKSATSG